MDPTAMPVDPSMTGAVPSAPVPQAPREKDPAQAAQISQFMTMVKAPSWLMDAFTEMDRDRKYVNRECMLASTKDTVAVNHILRNQHTMLAHLGLHEIEPFVQPAKQVSNIIAPLDDLIAQTVEVFLSKQITLTGLARKFDGACQDASTTRIAWMKVTLTTDFMRDPIGYPRFGDMQQEVARWEDLKNRVDAGEITETDARMAEYKDLDQTLRVYAAALVAEQIQAVPVLSPQQVVDPATGLVQTIMAQDPTDPRALERQTIVDGKEFDIYGVPKVDSLKAFIIDQVQPEDIRWDWNITRLEDVYNAEWIAHRVYMPPAAASRKWKLSQKDMGSAKMYGTNGQDMGCTYQTSNEDPSNRGNLESATINGNIAIWELWHKGHGRRYVFMDGMDYFLENDVPTDIGVQWYPFFPLGFLRTTGQMLPLSDTQLQRPVQDEYNMLRSHNREALRASYPVLFVPVNLMSKGAIQKYRDRGPFSVIEVARADDVNKYIKESTTVPYDPGKFAFGMNKAEQDMQKMAGIPTTVAGVVGSDNTATQDVMAKQGFDVLTTRRRNAATAVLTDMLKWMTEVAFKVWSEPAMKLVAGEAAVWPKLTMEEITTRLKIEVKGSFGSPAEAKNRLDFWTNAASIMRDLGLPMNPVTILRELLAAGNIRTSVERFIMPGIPGLTGAPPMGGPPGAPPQLPQNQGAQGQDGGAPPMTDRPVPNDPAQIPNHPPMA